MLIKYSTDIINYSNDITESIDYKYSKPDSVSTWEQQTKEEVEQDDSMHFGLHRRYHSVECISGQDNWKPNQSIEIQCTAENKPGY